MNSNTTSEETSAQQQPIGRGGNRKRPVLVWIIFIYILYSVTVGYFSYLSTIAYPESMPEAFRPYFTQLNFVDGMSSGIVQLSYLVAVIYLFRLKAVSFRLWAIALGISFIAGVYHVLLKDWGGVLLATHQKLGPFIMLLLPAAVTFYSYRLLRKKILT